MLHVISFRFYKFNGSLYYFETVFPNNEKYSWLESHAACINMFLFSFEHSANLASFQTKEEYDFIM